MNIKEELAKINIYNNTYMETQVNEILNNINTDDFSQYLIEFSNYCNTQFTKTQSNNIMNIVNSLIKEKKTIKNKSTNKEFLGNKEESNTADKTQKFLRDIFGFYLSKEDLMKDLSFLDYKKNKINKTEKELQKEKLIQEKNNFLSNIKRIKDYVSIYESKIVSLKKSIDKFNIDIVNYTNIINSYNSDIKNISEKITQIDKFINSNNFDI